MVSYVCDAKRRHPDIAKVIKILDWLDSIDLTGAQAFLGVCVYYQIWIFLFAIITKPIYQILKKRVEFVWGLGQVKTINTLKHKLVSSPTLISIDYTKDAEVIIFGMDANLIT